MTRYAAPGATASASLCTNPSSLSFRCSIAEAAAGSGVVSGDSVVIEPGNYSDSAGDLGGTGSVTPVAGNVHGAVGQPRPVIALNNGGGAGFTLTSQTLSHLEIDTSVRTENVHMTGTGGVIEGLIARSSTAQGVVCFIRGGTIRESACLASGANATAVGATGDGSSSSPQLSNITAISSGAIGTLAIAYRQIYTGSPGASINAGTTSVIARAAHGTDLYAGADMNANAAIIVDHSNYLTTGVGGGGAINSFGNNQFGPVNLAADGYHELATSTGTVDLGAVDADSGTADIDGQGRTAGAATDVGADELLNNQTTTELSCAPASLPLGSGAGACTATVTDPAAPVTSPSGAVLFLSSGPGTFSGGGRCLATAISASQARCELDYTPSAIGTHQITAVYDADNTSHDSSQGTAPIGVTAPPAPSSSTPPATAKKKCKKGRKLKHGRCVKKKKKRKG